MSHSKEANARTTFRERIKRVRKPILIAIGAFGVGIGASLALGYVFLRFPPSDARLITIANMETQLSGTLIGFMTIGLFYFFGVVHRFHDRFSQFRDIIYRNEVARLRGRGKRESIIDWARISLKFSRLLASLNDVLIYSAVSSVIYFGAAILLAMVAIDLLDTLILSLSLASMIIGISNVSFALVSVEDTCNGLDNLLNLAELRNSARQALGQSVRR